MRSCSLTRGLAERVFIVAPQLDADGIKDDGVPSRVEFSEIEG